MHKLTESSAVYTLPSKPWLAVMTASCHALQPDMLRCRVRATEAVGVIAASVGMEVLGPSLQDFVAAALRVRLHLPSSWKLHMYPCFKGYL